MTVDLDIRHQDVGLMNANGRKSADSDARGAAPVIAVSLVPPPKPSQGSVTVWRAPRVSLRLSPRIELIIEIDHEKEPKKYLT